MRLGLRVRVKVRYRDDATQSRPSQLISCSQLHFGFAAHNAIAWSRVPNASFAPERQLVMLFSFRGPT